MDLVLLIVAVWLVLDLVIVGAACALRLHLPGRRRSASTTAMGPRLVVVDETSVPASDR